MTLVKIHTYLLKSLRIVAILVAINILVYLLVLTYTNPSKELILAVSAELIFLVGILAIRFYSSKQVTGKVKKIVLEELLDMVPAARFLLAVITGILVILLSGFLIFTLVDLSALISVKNKSFDYAKQVYKAIPTSSLYDGAHPAFSLELLSGACIEAKKFKEAHIYTDVLLDIRRDIFGPNHWMYGGMVANLGNLYYQEGKYKVAENTYRRAIAICRSDTGDQNLGSALTRLGNCLREQGRFNEALEYYEKALVMRKREFGADSMRYAETEREMALLMTFLHKDKEADRLFTEVKSIIDIHHDEPNTDVISIVLFALGSVVVSYLLFSKRGYATKYVIKRLEKRTSDNGASPTKEDLKKLEELYELVGDQEKLEQLKLKHLSIAMVGALCIDVV